MAIAALREKRNGCFIMKISPFNVLLPKTAILLLSGLIALLLFAFPAYADRGITLAPKKQFRTALVIGNSQYETAPLSNPANDARDISEVLEKKGFDVSLHLDASEKNMKTAIKDFGKNLQKGGVGLFYFAGHGIQVKGRNYLIPIDASIETESDIEFEAVDAGRILGKMEDAENDLNIVILDACRNNPFSRSFRSAEKGLARMDAPKGSIIAYATAPGAVAADGDGKNGIFTKYLIQHMNVPGLKVEQVLKQVRMDVLKETRNIQVPWESSSLVGEFYFTPGKQNETAPVSKPTASSDLSFDAESEMWQMVKESSDPEEIMMFMEQYPGGRFSKHAQLKLARLKKVGQQAAEIEPPQQLTEGKVQRFSTQNGLVIDGTTGLMWAKTDNGSGIDWSSANTYCLNFNGGGYSNWRMPTITELKSIYDPESEKSFKILAPIDISACCLWSNNLKGADAASFFYSSGVVRWVGKSGSEYLRVLPVRGIK